jgi:N-acyl amino acid synthase of PEP-CTERM/exosortase system
MSTTTDIQERFSQHFEIVQATTPQLLSESYRLRYQVYCQEKRFPGFEPENYPNGEESDEYDERSVHSLLVHRPSGEVVGTVRLVLADPNAPDSPFPCEVHAGRLEKWSHTPMDRYRIAEISRFILSAKLRSRKIMEKSIHNISSDWADTTSPLIKSHQRDYGILGLIKAFLQSSRQYGIRYWLAAMEIGLDKRVRRCGIQLDRVTPTLDYYGPVNIYLSPIEAVMRRCHEGFPEVWNFLTGNGRIWPIDENIPLQGSIFLPLRQINL